MYPIALTLSLTDILILQAGAIVLGVAIHFFLASRKALRQTMMPDKNKKLRVTANDKLDLPDILPFSSPATAEKPKKEKAVLPQEAPPIHKAVKPNMPKEAVIDTFKETILQQQKSLNSFLQNVEALQGEEYCQLQKENAALKKNVTQLEALLEQNETELEGVKQQAAVAQKMAARIEEVYKEFDYMQDKMADLEKQSRQANVLSLELEDIKQSYLQAQNELSRKQTRLEEIIAENQRLHHQLSETEDKLAEANFQRQQLLKKAQLMQEMNDDMQHMADTNKKLQTELRRIGELESMLHTIEEERSHLFKRSHL